LAFAGYRVLMQLEDEDIREFAELWEEEFGETLSEKDARHHASRLLTLYELLATEPTTAEPDLPTPAP
jgi:hypothetical protein